MIEASKCLKANVNIVYSAVDTGRTLLERLLKLALCYHVKDLDVVVMREDSGKAVVYNMGSDQRNWIYNKEYIPY